MDEHSGAVRGRIAAQSLAAFDAAFTANAAARAAFALGPSAEPGAGPLPAQASLADAVLAIAEHGSVAVDGGGVLSRESVDTLLFRAWLFGVLTLLEARARERIERDPEWRGVLSEGRLQKAREIKDERGRRGRAMSTVDALQFGDVAWLATRDESWYARFGIESRRQAKQLVRKLEGLRNGLAHGQDIVTHDWETIVAVARSVVTIRGEETTARG